MDKALSFALATGIAVGTIGCGDDAATGHGDAAMGSIELALESKLDDPAARDAERASRKAANLAWIERTFATAREQRAAAVLIAMQADTWVPARAGRFAPLRGGRAARDGRRHLWRGHAGAEPHT